MMSNESDVLNRESNLARHGVMLRLPKTRSGVLGFDSVRMCGPWALSVRGMARAGKILGDPSWVEGLRDYAGCQMDWSPGEEFGARRVERGVWPRSGWVGAVDWMNESGRALEESWALKGARRPARWNEGGWAWSSESGCWMSQVFVLKGSSKDGSKIGEGRLEPLARTFWSWDKDVCNDEGRAWELFDADLVELARWMEAPGLRALLKGLEAESGVDKETIRGLRSRLEACEEKRALESVCALKEDSEGAGAKRL